MSEYHDMLVSAYMFNSFLYRLSFTERIRMDLDIVCYSPSFYSEEIDALPIKELEEKINSLKKPWWNYNPQNEAFRLCRTKRIKS